MKSVEQSHIAHDDKRATFLRCHFERFVAKFHRANGRDADLEANLYHAGALDVSEPTAKKPTL